MMLSSSPLRAPSSLCATRSRTPRSLPGKTSATRRRWICLRCCRGRPGSSTRRTAVSAQSPACSCAAAAAPGTSKLSAAYGGEVGATRFNVTVSRFDTRGFSAIDTRLAPLANPDPDGYRNESVSGNLIQRISAQHEVGILIYSSRGRLDYDSASGPPTDTHQSSQNLGMSQAYWEAHPFEPWTSRLTLGEGTDYRTDLLNGAFDS